MWKLTFGRTKTYERVWILEAVAAFQDSVLLGIYSTEQKAEEARLREAPLYASFDKLVIYHCEVDC